VLTRSECTDRPKSREYTFGKKGGGGEQDAANCRELPCQVTGRGRDWGTFANEERKEKRKWEVFGQPRTDVETSTPWTPAKGLTTVLKEDRGALASIRQGRGGEKHSQNLPAQEKCGGSKNPRPFYVAPVKKARCSCNALREGNHHMLDLKTLEKP